MVDLLFANGTVIDGTGSAGYRASVAVTGDTIQVITGDTSAVDAGRSIDANGYVICPGFIDMHSHSDLKLLTDPDHQPKIRQGVTTEVTGMDGLSYAPTTPRALEQLLVYLAAVNGAPPDVRWSSVADFLALFDGSATCNVAHMVPHAAIRVAAMGWSSRLPTDAELQTMRDLTRQGMRDGAFGFTTGLTYAPGAYSDTDELAAIAAVAAEEGGFYCTHARYTLGDRLLDPFREALEIGRRSGAPVHISHYHSPVAGLGQQMTALVDEARNRDQDVTFDQYPYPAASTILHSLLPYWVHAGGPQALMTRLADPNVRDLMVRAVEPQWGGQTLDNYIFAHIASDKNKEWEGRSLEDLAAHRGGRMVDAVCDLLLEEDLQVAFVARTGNLENIREIASHPAQMIGTDAILTGGRPNPRTYGTYPYVLAQFVRGEGLFSLEEAIRKMTGAPAQRLGLSDRGVIRDGAKADLVLFDPSSVHTPATFDDPLQFPVGIDYVAVNGALVIDNGRHTGARPGRALRSR
ncbi:MAG: D-aminoacylase [Chloroflexota bacterium]|nr:D-aminoacylase [Chloroflexota bacterium]MDE2958865.1 D-aminoacylase [Chloroflexota bacterium]